jgi:hypothetical protein
MIKYFMAGGCASKLRAEAAVLARLPSTRFENCR